MRGRTTVDTHRLREEHRWRTAHRAGVPRLRSWFVKPSPTRFSDDLAVDEYSPTPQDGSLDFPTEFAAEIGAYAAASLEITRLKGPLPCGVDEDEIGVRSDGDGTLARK